MSIVELFREIKNNNLNKIKEILRSKPNLLNKYLYGVTPFLYSIECGNQDVALEICNEYNSNLDLNLRDNEDKSCLEMAIENKMYKLVELICKKFKTIDLNRIKSNKETLLTNSLKLDDNDVTIALIKGGLDLNEPNELNEYPLELAIKFNKTMVVKEMIKTGNLNINNLKNSYNPLLDSCEKDLSEISILLIDSNANVNVQDADQQWTPLMHSIVNNNEQISLKLLEKETDLNLVDQDGNSATHLVVLSENDYLLRELIKLKPDLTIRNKENQTALDLAKANEDEISIKILSS